MLNTLNMILSILGIASSAASAYLTGDAKTGANIATAMVEIVQKAMAVHVAQTGQPIDPTLLKPFEPIV